MSVYDPRVLANGLEDLGAELGRWLAAANDTMSLAEFAQQQAQEALDQTSQRVGVMQDRLEEDQRDLDNAGVEVSRALERTRAAVAQAYATQEAAGEAVGAANATLKLWESELAQALDWLRRAQEWLARAEAELERAHAALRSAINALSRAQGALGSCRSDRRRSNCFGEEAAVAAAAFSVRQAESRVQAAEAEVAAAAREVARAEARVACCQRAVALATEAVAQAGLAVEESDEAASSAERSQEQALAAERMWAEAVEQLREEREAAERAEIDLGGIASLVQDALRELLEGRRTKGNTHQHCTDVRQELSYRVDQLIELNRPMLDSSAGF